MKPLLNLAAVIAVSLTACQKESKIKPVSQSPAQVFTDKVSVHDDLGVLTYTYEIKASDQQQLAETRKQLESVKLVPLSETEAQKQMSAMKPADGESNVSLIVHVERAADFNEAYKAWKGSDVFFGLAGKDQSKAYTNIANVQNISEIEYLAGFSKIWFTNQTYYFNLGSLAYTRNCTITGYKNQSSNYFDIWHMFGLEAYAYISTDAIGTPLNNITKFKATTLAPLTFGTDYGRMSVLASVYVP